MPALPAHRIMEELEEVVLLVRTKVRPRVALLLVALLGLAVLALGLGLGLAAAPGPASSTGPAAFLFLSNHSASCPALRGERLLTTLEEGDSFEGLAVSLQCRGSFIPFPLTVRCQRAQEVAASSLPSASRWIQVRLEWSGLPVCLPASLISAGHWAQAPHARSVSCTGTPQRTECRLQCVLDYVPVEERPYSCTDLPCRAWTLPGRSCFRCDRKCSDLARRRDPALGHLLAALGCDPDCLGIVVTSQAGAAVWQNKRTGLFSLVGEHRGRPVYQKNATKEFLYYSEGGAEWLVGPDFRSSHGGIQISRNTDRQCPERAGGPNQTRMYIDGGAEAAGAAGLWRRDDTLELQCHRPALGQTPVEWCDCRHYDLSLGGARPRARPALGEGPPHGAEELKYLAGRYSRVATEDSFGLLAPLYRMAGKGLLLFSHHPHGLVWQVSPSLTTTPLRGLATSTSCPDAPGLRWQRFNGTSAAGAQLYVPADTLTVTCVIN